MISVKIYLAAPWVERENMEVTARVFETAGHQITHKWWDVVGDEKDSEFLRTCAIEDVQGVLQADVVVLINSAKSEGKAVEQGIAITAGIPIIAVGMLGEFSLNVFHYLDNYTWVSNVSEALQEIEKL